MRARAVVPVVVLVLSPFGAVPITLAQPMIPPGTPRPAAPTGATVEGQEVEGEITAVDVVARTITLDNREAYVIPASLPVNWNDLAVGGRVKLRYGVDGGRNLATALKLDR